MVAIARGFTGTLALLLLVLTLAIILSGCSTPVAVLGHCELPSTLTAGPAPLDHVAPNLSLEAQHQQWARDRGVAAANAHGWTETVKYVGEHCQGQDLTKMKSDGPTD